MSQWMQCSFVGHGITWADSTCSTTFGRSGLGGDDAPRKGIDWQVKRRKLTLRERPEAHLRDILDRVVSEYYGEIVASDLPQSVKKEAAAVVKPFADKEARFKSVPPVAQVDWNALQRDADAVSAILRIWSDELAQREIDDEDEFLMMMH